MVLSDTTGNSCAGLASCLVTSKGNLVVLGSWGLDLLGVLGDEGYSSLLGWDDSNSLVVDVSSVLGGLLVRIWRVL